MRPFKTTITIEDARERLRTGVRPVARTEELPIAAAAGRVAAADLASTLFVPPFSRSATVEWHQVGSEIEALLLEAEWITTLTPVSNVQVSAPAMDRRAIPGVLLRDTLLVLPSASEGAVELLAARVDGTVLLQRASRDGKGLAARAAALRRFFAGQPVEAATQDSRTMSGLAPLVFSWLAGRGASATRLDPHDVPSARELQRRLQLLFDDTQLFSERLVVIRSTTPLRAARREGRR